MHPDLQHNPDLEPKASSFSISVITDRDRLVQLEHERVMFYLGRYADYQKLTYLEPLRFPDGIDPTHPPSSDQVREMVASELDRDKKLYHGFTETFSGAIDQVTNYALPVAQELYGFPLHGNFEIAPTAYGTIRSPNKTIHVRLSEFLPSTLGAKFSTGVDRTSVEMLVHELVAHKATAKLREATCITESIDSHQLYKERLMDLLGRSILVQSGMLRPNQVAMQVHAEQEASVHIDPLYYSDSSMPSETDLPWAGDLSSLVTRIDTKLTELLGHPSRNKKV